MKCIIQGESGDNDYCSIQSVEGLRISSAVSGLPKWGNPKVGKSWIAPGMVPVGVNGLKTSPNTVTFPLIDAHQCAWLTSYLPHLPRRTVAKTFQTP